MIKIKSLAELTEYKIDNKTTTSAFEIDNEQVVFILVGLPARGKSFISGRISRYLNWYGINTKVFNVGNYRRKLLGVGQSFDFFDSNNEKGKAQRKELSISALNDMMEFFQNNNGNAAVF